MKKIIISSFVTFLMFVSSINLNAQTPFNVLNELLGSEFIQRFDVLRIDAENMVSKAKRLEGYHSDEVESLQIAYDVSSEYFNLLLHNIKVIMLTKQKRKYYFGHQGANIVEFHKLIETDLSRAERMFNQTFRKEYLNLLSNDDEDVDQFVGTLIVLVTEYLPQAIEIFKKIQSEVKKYNEELLDTYLIEEHRFKSWDELY